MTNEQQKSFPDQLRDLAEQLEKGTVKNVVVCLDNGWSGQFDNPSGVIVILLDAILSIREAMKAAAIQQQMQQQMQQSRIVSAPPGMKFN